MSVRFARQSLGIKMARCPIDRGPRQDPHIALDADKPPAANLVKMWPLVASGQNHGDIDLIGPFGRLLERVPAEDYVSVRIAGGGVCCLDFHVASLFTHPPGFSVNR